MRKVLFILGQLTDRDSEWLASAGARQRVPKGTVLIKEGERVDTLFIVLGGRLEVMPAGSTRGVPCGAGEILGEMSFVDASPPSATVTATEDSSVLAIPRQVLLDRLGVDDGFAGRFYRAIAMFLSDRLRHAHRQSAGPGTGSGLEEDELDPAVLDSLALAGDRFDRMLRQLGGVA